MTLPDRGVVVEIDPKPMTVRTRSRWAPTLRGSRGGGSVWVTNSGSRPSPASARRPVSRPNDRRAGGANRGRGRPRGVWVANGLDASVSHIDPGAAMCWRRSPWGRARRRRGDDHGVWVANSTSGTVSGSIRRAISKCKRFRWATAHGRSLPGPRDLGRELPGRHRRPRRPRRRRRRSSDHRRGGAEPASPWQEILSGSRMGPPGP